jgi:hypothetical protein
MCSALLASHYLGIWSRLKYTADNFFCAYGNANGEHPNDAKTVTHVGTIDLKSGPLVIRGTLDVGLPASSAQSDVTTGSRAAHPLARGLLLSSQPTGNGNATTTITAAEVDK